MLETTDELLCELQSAQAHLRHQFSVAIEVS